jgi:hypothetical protein
MAAPGARSITSVQDGVKYARGDTLPGLFQERKKDSVPREGVANACRQCQRYRDLI